MTKPPRIAKAQGRSVPEWCAKSPDDPVPKHVRLRVLRRFDNKCYLTGILIADGQPFDMEDIVPLEEGGMRRESNLAPALRLPHEVKTAAERKRQAKADRVAAKGHGIAPEPARKIESRGFAKTDKTPRIEKTPLPPRELYKDVTQ